MKKTRNPNAAANLPTEMSNARQGGRERLHKEAIQLLLKPGPSGRYRTVADVSEQTGVPRATIYADLRRIREDGLAHCLPAHHQAGRPGGESQPVGRFSYPLFEATQVGAFAQTMQHEPEPVGVFESDALVQPANKPGAVPPFAILVRGDSMTNPSEEWHFPAGSKVLVDPSLTPHIGDFVVVADSEGGGSTLKLLDWLRLEGEEQPGPALRALNPDPRYGPFLYDNTNNRFRVIGVVVDSQLPAYKRRSTRT